MHENFNLLTVQNALGYVFKDASLIKTAFVHKSYEAKGEENNVSLAFLGKQLLSFVLCDYITSRLPYSDEKQLSYQVESYLSALNTDGYIKEKGLSRFVMLSAINEPMRDTSTLGKEIFYAIVAAIYRDGGLPSLKGFLMPIIRACGGDTHYQPTTEGKIITGTDEGPDGVPHIKNERLRRPAKSGSIGFSKAETVNNESVKKAEPTKKEKNISKLLKKKEDVGKALREKPQKKAKNEEITSIPEPEEAPRQERKFIRDPFAPVKLSDELRNFKPKKPSKYEEKSAMPERTPSKPLREPTPSAVTQNDDANYKSLLQEYVQKNIRSSNVLLKYGVTQVGRGKWRAEIKLQEHSLAKGEGDSKKEAEKAAARLAYQAICDKSTSEHKWFASLGNGSFTVNEPSSDYVSKINQHFQRLNRCSNVPVAYEKKNSGKRKEFLVSVVFDGKEIAEGRASTLKEAKQNAAKVACEKLGI